MDILGMIGIKISYYLKKIFGVQIEGQNNLFSNLGGLYAGKWSTQKLFQLVSVLFLEPHPFPFSYPSEKMEQLFFLGVCGIK